MKVIGKIIFFIFFFLVSFTNIGNDVEACQQRISISNHKSARHYTLENEIDESFIAIPSNIQTKTFSADLDDIGQSSFAQKYYFKNNKILNKQYHAISFLYKTEVFPNAP